MADVMVLVQGLLPLVILLLVVFYILGEKKLKEQRMAQRKQATLNQPAAERQRQAATTRAPRPVRNEEIEEFLRRAAQQRGEQSAAQRTGAGRAPAKPERMTGSVAAPRTPSGTRPAKPVVEAYAAGIALGAALYSAIFVTMGMMSKRSVRARRGPMRRRSSGRSAGSSHSSNTEYCRRRP